MRVGVLDLGSNSFRMLVADVGPEGQLTRVLLEREMLHLGAVVGRLGKLSEDALDDSAKAVKRLTALAKRTDVDEFVVVATSAIRDASNRDDVLDVLGAAAGVPVRVLSGEEEAQLSFAGVRGAIGIEGQELHVLDLGGGSLEVVTGGRNGVSSAASYPLGVSRMHAEVVDSDPLGAETVERIRTAVIEAIPLVQAEGRIVAVGGTVRALAQIHAAETMAWSPPSLNMLAISVEDLGRMADRLAAATVDERRHIPGMKESRVEHIGTAATILHQALSCLGAEFVQVADWGLREGVALEQHGMTRAMSATDLRRFEVEHLRKTFGPQDGHAELVARLGGAVFDQTARLHGLDRNMRELLEYALLLHDVGRSLSTDGYHRHSAYLVENAELRGFTPHEVGILASLVRFSRTGKPKAGYLPYRSLDGAQESDVAKLAALVQLADGLDWARDLSVKAVHLADRDGSWTMNVVGDGAEVRPDVVELAEHRFAEAFGVPLRIDAASVM